MNVLRFVTALFAILLGACGKSGPPYSPREALATFRIQPGYKVEIFATEPDIASPVAMEFDESGRVYVVEDAGYPLDLNHRGRVKLLQDTNGDGRPDRTTVFADKLVLPTGIMRWKKASWLPTLLTYGIWKTRMGTAKPT